MNTPTAPSQPPPTTRRSRRVVSIAAGNTIQITGILLGIGFFWISAQPISTGSRVAVMLTGYLFLYFNSHSLMHYSAGKLVGLQFRHYSIGGSSHAASYPRLMRWIFERLPFFAVHTEPASMKAARPAAKAFMFSAGILGTVVFCTLGAIYAYRAHSPGALALLIFNGIWLISSLIAEFRSSGDLGKAFNLLKKSNLIAA